jgi:transketolase
MRKQFCDAMVARAAQPHMAFLTGDLGFMALEPLQAALGERFINAGIAEQNMLSVAAAMARTGMEVWAYSIAPFAYARPFEQIRNDVALHGLPVKVVGNGGGFGYGVMGPTHHAIEDYGVMLALPGMQACVPVFDEDVEDAVSWVAGNGAPTYLRLGRGEPPKGHVPPAFAPWRQLVAGDGPVVLAVGPLASTYIAAVESLSVAERPNLWALAALPVALYEPPAAFLEQLRKRGRLVVAEEHVAQGGVGAALALWLASRGACPARFELMCATAHRYERYGSQSYLRKQSGLDPAALLARLTSA